MLIEKREVHISDIVHNCRIDVTETGTEHSEERLVVRIMHMVMPKKFVANHPFVYVVHNQLNGMPFLIGSKTQ